MAAIIVPGLYAVVLASYLQRTLGPGAFAVWAAALAVIGWLALLDVGLSATTARATARAIAGDDAAVGQVRAAYAAYAALGILAIALGAVVATAIPAFLGLRDEAARDAWLVGALLALDLGVVVATAGWMGTLRGSRRFRSMLVVNVVQVAVAGALLVVLLPPLGLVGAAAAQPIGRICARAFAAALLSRTLGWFAARPRWPGWPAVRTLTTFSLPVLAMQASAQLGVGTDVLIVGAATGATTAGLYAAGAQLSRYVGFFLFPALGVLLPSFSTAYFERPETIRLLLPRAVVLAGLVGGAVYGSMALEARPLLELWAGHAAELSVGVLVLYAAAWTIVTPTHAMTLMVVAGGRHAAIGAIVLAEALVNLALSIVLVSAIGPIGAAVSSFVVILIDDVLIIPAATARLLDVPLAPLLAASLGGAAGGAGIALAAQLVALPGLVGLIVRGGLTAAALLVIVAAVPATRAILRSPPGPPGRPTAALPSDEG
jgi:O-antigen/teichoic acid export membrane protein